MENKVVNVKMFQTLELEYNGKVLNEHDSRSQKLWLLLSYIIYHRNKLASQDAVLADIWNSGNEVGTNVLKTTLHRLRIMLSETFSEEFGRDFISCHNKQYSIDESYTVICDFEEFDNYIKKARTVSEEEERLNLYRKAFELYRGDFLGTFSEVAGITPISTYFHYLYLDLIRDMLEICEKKRWYTESIEILRRAGEVEKYEESIYIHLIRNLIRTGNYKDAVQVYRYLNDMMEAAYGLQPSKEAKELYYEAMSGLSTVRVDIEDIPKMVFEQEADKGALYCEFTVFKELYQAYYRGVERNGNEIRLVLISITDIRGTALSKRSLNVCIANLKRLLCENLRSGDIVSMCTPSQFVLLLPNAGEKAAEAAMERISKVFYKQYPHTPAKLTVKIGAMEAVEKKG